MQRTPTNEQVATIVRHLARLHLEIERGLRPPGHLERVMSEHAYRVLRSRNRAHFPGQGPVDPSRDLGHVRVSHYPDGRVFASVATREEGERWGAVTMQLQPTGRGLQVTELGRLRRGEMIHQRRPADPSVGLGGRIRRAEDERRIIEAALCAERRRLSITNEGGGPAASGRSMIEPLSSRLRDLGAELQILRTRLDVHTALQDQVKADRQSLSCITRLIGDPPDDERQCRLWNTVRTEIENYREAWDVTDPVAALGPNPANPAQRRHRDRVIEILRAMSPQLTREASTTHHLDRPLNHTT